MYKDDLVLIVEESLIDIQSFVFREKEKKVIKRTLIRDLLSSIIVFENLNFRTTVPNGNIALIIYLVLIVSAYNGESSLTKIKTMKNRLRTTTIRYLITFCPALEIIYCEN